MVRFRFWRAPPGAAYEAGRLPSSAETDVRAEAKEKTTARNGLLVPALQGEAGKAIAGLLGGVARREIHMNKGRRVAPMG